jgi:hypothetical protein
MTILDVIRSMSERPDITLSPPAGIPVLNPEHQLPDDLLQFYRVCGGMRMRNGLEITILTPEQVILTNKVILKDLSDDQLKAISDDITWSWYTIARDDNGDYLSIDLDPARMGRCYDSFWDCHGVPGSCAIIARSFTELLVHLIQADPLSDQPYWFSESFTVLGDAYD